MNTYLEASPRTSMRKGWLCRNSYDKKNQEIAPVMMIQQRCSISSDDPDLVMMPRDDPDPEMMLQR